MQPPFIFIVVVQYNNSKDTLNCLDSLGQLKYPNFKVAVVDNASEEAEKNTIRSYISSQVSKPGAWILLENKENLGYAGGNNVGIKYALQNGADYVFVLNNDTTVEPDCLEKLVKAAEEDPKVGIVGPATKEGGGQVAYYGKISWLKPELNHIYGESAIHPLEDSRAKSRGSKVGGMADLSIVLGPKKYVIGAGMLIKRAALEKVEGFDKVYFLYFEDADFCIRAQLAGFKLKIVPEAVIHHKVSASTSRLGSPLVLRYHMRNALIFNSLNAPWFIKPLIILWAGWILLKNLVKISLFPEKEAVGGAIIDGVLDFYKNKFGKLELEIKTQKAKVKITI